MADLPSFPPGTGSRTGLGLFGPSGAVEGPTVCSRKGCGEAATAVLLWNNPRIHAPERRKSWASCPNHVGWFEQYLGDRGLWKETVALEDMPDRPVTRESD